MRATTLLWYVASTGGALVFLWLVGLPVQLALDAISGGRRHAAAIPVFGVFVVTTASWYVLQVGHVIGKLPALLGVAATAVSLAFVIVGTRVHRPMFQRREMRDGVTNVVTATVVFGLNTILTLFTLGALYSGQALALSLFNADPASYALHAQFMLDGGFHRSGPIVGYNMGAGEKALGYGADALLANVAALFGTDVVHVLHVAVLIATFLGVYGLVRLLNGRLGVSRPLAVLAAQAGYSVFFVAYLEGNFFLSQLLAMALLPAFLTVVMDAIASHSSGEWVAGVLATGALSAAGIAIYPQMTLLTAAMFVPAIAFIGPLGGLIRRVGRGSAVVGCGIGVGVLAVPALARVGWHLITTLGSAQAGWKISGLLVTDMLGFQTARPPQHQVPHHSLIGWAVSAVILASIAWIVYWMRRRAVFLQLTSFAAVAVPTIIISYVVFFVYEGVSYQQWKWITYFIPLLVALLTGLLLTALSVASERLADGLSAAQAVGGAYLLVATALAGGASFPSGTSPSAYYAVLPDMARVARASQVKELTSVNIRGDTMWDTMWLAYFLRAKELYLASSSYFPLQKPVAEWTIENNDEPPSLGDVIQLNATYRLVHVAPTNP